MSSTGSSSGEHHSALADLCARMSAYRVEVAQDDTLERRSCVDRIPDNLLVDLLRVSIRRHSGFDRGILGYRKFSGSGCPYTVQEEENTIPSILNSGIISNKFTKVTILLR